VVERVGQVALAQISEALRGADGVRVPARAGGVMMSTRQRVGTSRSRGIHSLVCCQRPLTALCRERRGVVPRQSA
jgi:hypothetical protein